MLSITHAIEESWRRGGTDRGLGFDSTPLKLTIVCCNEAEDQSENDQHFFWSIKCFTSCLNTVSPLRRIMGFMLAISAIFTSFDFISLLFLPRSEISIMVYVCLVIGWVVLISRLHKWTKYFKHSILQNRWFFNTGPEPKGSSVASTNKFLSVLFASCCVSSFSNSDIGSPHRRSE